MSSRSPNRFTQVHPTSPLARLLSAHKHNNSAFITRLDRAPLSSKRRTFLNGLALNLFILAFVSCLAAVTTVHHYESPSLALSVCLTQYLLVFWAIVVLLCSTSVPFFLGECRLRIRYGFRPTELVIRRLPIPPLTNTKDLTDNHHMEHYWRLATRAVNPRRLYSNPSAILSSDYWTNEYNTIFHAYNLILTGELQEEELEFAIFRQEGGSWTSCQLWRMHELMNDQQEVIMFRALLAKEGKGNLLSIWQGMLPTSDKGQTHPSTEQRTYQAMVSSFAREGLDYEALWFQISENAPFSSS